uniref:Uncharacterized protein n=1 Tax=Chromera velia CCMP2878 TaxID=1169474 RepID=A0A0G4HDN4_9ALVE|eukprot:Cvel_6462.t1-p1 / transcript=Cvel_6462.t1 / gene=Cvel_6462 / organism=Chromera_velia_CCMP2878 / gene_product=hypothetical protein / transcript_product=hypothetical protein / location=Cvel_scaffold316:79234-81127(+) / protein_length=425 / sequence_SO=supercontig / SO=protein_coding / is_pseudo=false
MKSRSPSSRGGINLPHDYSDEEVEEEGALEAASLTSINEGTQSGADSSFSHWRPRGLDSSDFRVFIGYRLSYVRTFWTLSHRRDPEFEAKRGMRRRTRSDPVIPVTVAFNEFGFLQPVECSARFLDSLPNVGSLVHKPNGNCQGRACFHQRKGRKCAFGWLCRACHFCQPLPPSHMAVSARRKGRSLLRKQKTAPVREGAAGGVTISLRKSSTCEAVAGAPSISLRKSSTHGEIKRELEGSASPVGASVPLSSSLSSSHLGLHPLAAASPSSTRSGQVPLFGYPPKRDYVGPGLGLQRGGSSTRAGRQTRIGSISTGTGFGGGTGRMSSFSRLPSPLPVVPSSGSSSSHPPGGRIFFPPSPQTGTPQARDSDGLGGVPLRSSSPAGGLLDLQGLTGEGKREDPGSSSSGMGWDDEGDRRQEQGDD